MVVNNAAIFINMSSNKINIKRISVIGIIGALFLISNYLLRFVSVDDSYQTIKAILFYVGYLMFYFALQKYLKFNKFNVESKFVAIILLLQILSFILVFVDAFLISIGLILEILSVIVFVLFVLTGIKLLKQNNNEINGLKLLKLFIILILFSFIFSSIMIFLDMYFFNYPFLDINQKYFVFYILPYFIGVLFWRNNLKHHSTDTLLTKTPNDF